MESESDEGCSFGEDVDELRVQCERQSEGQLVVQVDDVDDSSRVIEHPPAAPNL